MLVSLLLSTIVLPLQPPQDPPTPEPTSEVRELSPAEAVVTIKDALKGKDTGLAVTVVENHGMLADKKVAQTVAGGLKHKDREVRMACVEALRFNTDKAAIDALLKQKNNKKLLDDEDDELMAAYFWALGQHGDRRALPILTDNIFASGADQKVVRARILSIGRVRDKASVDELIQLMNSKRGRGGANAYMKDVRVALIALTGEDHGGDKTAWLQWWGDNKRSLKISKEEWPLPPKYEKAWKLHWATPDEKAEYAERRKNKGGRGGKDDDAEKEDF